MEPTISSSRLYEALKSEPQAVLDVILTNNADAVANNLVDMGFDRPTTREQVREYILWLYRNGDKDKAVQALSVPMLNNTMLPEQMAVVLDVNQRYQGNTGLLQRFQLGGAEVGAEDILSGLAVGWITMMDNAQGGDTNTGGNGGAGAPPPASPPGANNRMWWWIAGGVVAVVVVVLIVRNLKK